MEHLIVCPHRADIWSHVQTTKFTQPLVFRGDAHDLQLLAACKENPDEPVEAVQEGEGDNGKIQIWHSILVSKPSNHLHGHHYITSSIY
jgi:hypothetical protein